MIVLTKTIQLIMIFMKVSVKMKIIAYGVGNTCLRSTDLISTSTMLNLYYIQKFKHASALLIWFQHQQC